MTLTVPSIDHLGLTARLALTLVTPTAEVLSLIFLLILLVTGAASNVTQAQSCNPAVVSYLVRDEKGELLGAEDLKALAAGFPEKVGKSQISVDEVSFAEDGTTFYWPESVDWQKGKKSPALNFANAETCTMNLTQIVLVYNKKMSLIFNIDITRSQADRRPVIDSLPFQEGTFELDLEGWSRDRDKIIPAERWKKSRSTS